MLEAAGNEFLYSVLAGNSFREGMARFAHAAGAEGMLLVSQGALGANEILETDSISDPVSRYRRGEAPPDPRSLRVNQSLSEGFAGDLHFFSREEIERDAFYQEFLARYRIGWHASALLAGDPVNGIYASLKRRADRGPYLADEIAALDRTLPLLRAIVQLAQGAVDDVVQRMATPFEARSDGVVRLSASGHVVGMNRIADGMIRARLPVHRNRLLPMMAGDRIKLEAGIASAIAGRPALVPVTTSGDFGQLLVLLVPVGGLARDVFLRTAVLAVLIDTQRPIQTDEKHKHLLREAFELTRMEAEIAGEIAAGSSIKAAAAKFRIAPETARMHLKAVFRKTETGRQTELAALLARIRF